MISTFIGIATYEVQLELVQQFIGSTAYVHTIAFKDAGSSNSIDSVMK